MPLISIYRKLFLVKKFVINSKPPLAFLHKIEFLLNPISRNQHYISSSTLLHSSNKNSCNGDHYTVSYLRNQCGLSLEDAIFASKYVHLTTPERPDSVLTLFKNHEFTKTQIAKLVRKRPLLLRSDPEKTLLPKLQFLQSIGASNTHLAQIVSKDPTLLLRSMENRIIPSYNFLKTVLQSDEKIVKSLRRTPWILMHDPAKNLVPNIAVLREFRVRESCIVFLLTSYPEAALLEHHQFRKAVKVVSEMGFDPLKTMFVSAVHVLLGKANKQSHVQSRKEYKKWGWSDDDIQLAFRRHPNCMIFSVKKISATLDFLVNKMGWQSMVIVRWPVAISYSLQKRIIPRFSVIQVLLMKGLIKKMSLSMVLKRPDKYFLEMFVKKYKEEEPQLLSVYQGKVNPLEL